MKVSITVPRFVYEGGDAAIGAEFAGIARDADQAGLDTLWVMDHFFQIEMVGPPNEPMLEGYTALAFAAGQTERIRLGTLVTGVTYRHPGILAKTVTTLDVLSGGRAWLGIGAGWNETEHLGLGVPFPSTSERFERLEETLEIVNQMWSDNDGPYVGDHFHLAETLCQPQPVTRPHPPILIGGGGEQKTLRLVAQYADACNFFAAPTDEAMATLAHKRTVLREHCERIGRDFSEIETSVLGPFPSTIEHPLAIAPDQFPDFLAQLHEAGVDQYVSPVINRENLHTLIDAAAPVMNLAVAAR